MTAPSLRDSQLAMARYLRDPEAVPAPPGIEQRRLKIYEDLVYSNIEGFISGGFPVLRSLYGDAGWHELVRSFIGRHRCHSPYFLEISREFLEYLAQEHRLRECDPPFIAELAHYEWVELALDVSVETLPPESGPEDDPLATVPVLSPLAWLLSYNRRAVKLKPVIVGLLLQLVFAVAVFKIQVFRNGFHAFARGAEQLIRLSDEGARFLFG